MITFQSNTKIENMHIIIYLGLSHILFGIILILSKEKRSRADLILIMWLLTLIVPFSEFLIVHLFKGSHITSKLLNQSFTLLNGPYLYIYIRELIRKEKSTNFNYRKHFVIFMLFYLLLVINPEPLHPGGPIDPIESGFHPLKYFGFINITYFIFYGFLTISLIVKNNLEIKNIFAYRNNRLTLYWLAALPIIFILLTLIVVLIETLGIYKSSLNNIFHLYIFLVLALYLIFFSIKQRPIYIELKKKVGENNLNENSTIISQLEKITKVMEEDKLYKNPSLSIYDLSNKIGVPKNKLSSIINDELSLNFFQFVNQYRLQEVVDLFKDDEERKYNILDLAYESGFNSKSSFNSLFKQHYNMTPSQYRKKLHKKV